LSLAAIENNVFTDSRERTIIVNTPRIVPKGMKRHSMHAIFSVDIKMRGEKARLDFYLSPSARKR
jgi:hypothetical protein